jgi:hypothetical protein
VAFWRRAISAKRGCCHVPVWGVDGVVCAVGVEGAFEGVESLITGADMMAPRERLLQSILSQVSFLTALGGGRSLMLLWLVSCYLGIGWQ